MRMLRLRNAFHRMATILTEPSNNKLPLHQRTAIRASVTPFQGSKRKGPPPVRMRGHTGS